LSKAQSDDSNAVLRLGW